MTDATGDNTKRKRPTQIGQLVGVRLQPEQLAALDEWIADQSDPKPTRPEALRKHLAWSLDRSSSKIGDHPHTKLPKMGTGRDVV